MAVATLRRNGNPSTAAAAVYHSQRIVATKATAATNEPPQHNSCLYSTYVGSTAYWRLMRDGMHVSCRQTKHSNKERNTHVPMVPQ